MYLDGELCNGEIEGCIFTLKNNKTGGGGGLEGELLGYGKVGMVDVLHWHLELLGIERPYLSSGRGIGG